MALVLRLSELARDQEVLGLNPATSELFSREPPILKFILY